HPAGRGPRVLVDRVDLARDAQRHRGRRLQPHLPAGRALRRTGLLAHPADSTAGKRPQRALPAVPLVLTRAAGTTAHIAPDVTKTPVLAGSGARAVMGRTCGRRRWARPR